MPFRAFVELRQHTGISRCESVVFGTSLFQMADGNLCGNVVPVFFVCVRQMRELIRTHQIVCVDIRKRRRSLSFPQVRILRDGFRGANILHDKPCPFLCFISIGIRKGRVCPFLVCECLHDHSFRQNGILADKTSCFAIGKRAVQPDQFCAGIPLFIRVHGNRGNGSQGCLPHLF